MQQSVHGCSWFPYKEVAALTKGSLFNLCFFFFLHKAYGGPSSKSDRNSVCLDVKQGHGHRQATERINDTFIYLRSGCAEMIVYLSLFMEKFWDCMFVKSLAHE